MVLLRDLAPAGLVQNYSPEIQDSDWYNSGRILFEDASMM